MILFKSSVVRNESFGDVRAFPVAAREETCFAKFRHEHAAWQVGQVCNLP